MTFYANKRWGHGRLKQLIIRTYCRLVGHAWKKRPSEGISYCERRCGGMEKRRW